MSRGTNALKPEGILYGSLQRGPVSQLTDTVSEVMEAWQRLSREQKTAIAAIFDLEQSSILDSVGYDDQRQRWDISMICYHLLEGCNYEDKEDRKEYQAKITRLLVSAKPSGLITNKRYPGIRHVRWKLTEAGEEIAEMYHAGELEQKPPT